MIEWEPNKNDANLNMPVDRSGGSICWRTDKTAHHESCVFSSLWNG